jgi:hypothetical protein
MRESVGAAANRDFITAGDGLPLLQGMRATARLFIVALAHRLRPSTLAHAGRQRSNGKRLDDAWALCSRCMPRPIGLARTSTRVR